MAAKSEEMLGFSAGNRGLLESRFRGPEHIGGRPAIPRRRRGLVTRMLVVANLTASGALRQNPQMPSLIERASSGRAKCRTCGLAIARGQERFGEALPSAYGEGESLFWFHLTCAACSRPESLLPALAQSQLPPEERERLTRLAQGGIEQPRLCRLARAELASSGRARCRHCRELIEQGAFRLALHMFEEGRFTPIGTIHAACAVHYLGAEPTPERLSLPHNELSPEELAQVLAQVREGAARAITPGLAKTSGAEPELESSRRSS